MIWQSLDSSSTPHRIGLSGRRRIHPVSVAAPFCNTFPCTSCSLNVFETPPPTSPFSPPQRARREVDGCHPGTDEWPRIDSESRSEEHTSELQSRSDLVC